MNCKSGFCIREKKEGKQAVGALVHRMQNTPTKHIVKKEKTTYPFLKNLRLAPLHRALAPALTPRLPPHTRSCRCFAQTASGQSPNPFSMSLTSSTSSWVRPQRSCSAVQSCPLPLGDCRHSLEVHVLLGSLFWNRHPTIWP